MISIGILLLLSGITLFFYMRQEKFGKKPAGARLEKIQQSPNYKNGQFQNLHETPSLSEGYTFMGVIYEQLFKRVKRTVPEDSIPSVKINLLELSPDEDILVWFGHSGYFIQLDGKRFLVDPVFSGSVSPIPGTAKAFKGADRYTVSDLPPIDYLLISHDHYDHLDYTTILQLKDKVKKVVCGLGVGEHFEFWGYEPKKVTELDWNQDIDLGDGFSLFTHPARHFSGRSIKRNNTLWLSFLLQTPSMKLYIGGDSGYDTHFAEIGKKHGPIDLAILENGQYDIKWRYIHMLPPETLQAAKDLGAKRLMPVHNSKFAIANHAWDHPMTTLAELNKDGQIPLVTPRIGEPVQLKDSTQPFTAWWQGIQ